ncbi:MAG: pyrroline-5-carboxylate reductase [Phycisphaerae bacterium]
MSYPYALGVIGAGHIAGVIVRRLIDGGYYEPSRIVASESRTLREHPLPVTIVEHNRDVARQANMLLISVTPQQFKTAAAGIEAALTDDHLLVSVMAGVSTDTVDAAFPRIAARVVRCMPNLPFGLGYGVTGVCRGRHATQDDVEAVRHLFNAGGVTLEIKEQSLMDAVTAVAGSGPAYFYYFVEAMIEAGQAAGLTPADAQVLAAHACMGAGAMLLDKGASPRELRLAVTSPGGTTEAAMNVLTSGHVTELVTQAVSAAFRRGRELGRQVNA